MEEVEATPILMVMVEVEELATEESMELVIVESMVLATGESMGLATGESSGLATVESMEPASVESMELATVEESEKLNILDGSFIWPHVATGLPLAATSVNRIWPAILKWQSIPESFTSLDLRQQSSKILLGIFPDLRHQSSSKF